MDMKTPSICFVSACPTLGGSISEHLTKEGFQVDWIRNTEQALEKINNTDYDAVVSDMCLPDMSGAHFLKKLFEDTKNTPPTLFIAEHNSVDKAEKLLKLGAVDYITKNFDLDALITKLRELCFNSVDSHSQKENYPLGISPSMRQVEEKIKILAPYNQTPVLIIGESGVGKEVVARRLHAMQDSAGPFVAINCAAIPHSLIESELFGHEKGAFTGSTNRHKGVFEQANNGTLLLDEIGEMPLATQAKLLRVIQEQIVVRLGGEQDIPVNLRIICATNCDLRAMVECGEFREDLYYRINVIELNIQPLRRRQEDILWLAQQFLNIHSELYPDKTKNLNGLAGQSLLEYSWPGNVRELKNTIERTCIMTPGSTIFSQDIFPQQTETANEEEAKTLKYFLQTRERSYIDVTLRENNWNIMNTATTLGISRKSLWEKMKKYDMHNA